MPNIPNFTDEWDGGAVLESSGLVTINGVSLENLPDWHSFTLNFGHAIRGTVAEASRNAFLAAIEAGSTGLPLTVYECHCDDPHLVSEQIEFDDWPYVIRGDALQPWGHSVAWKLKACRHVIVAEEITWTFDGDNAVGTISTDPALNWWGFLPYGAAPSIVRQRGEEDYGVSLETQNFIVEGNGADMLVCFVATRDGQSCTGVDWIPDTGSAGDTDAFTQVGSTVTVGSGSDTVRLTAWTLHEPRASVQPAGGIVEPTLAGGNRSAAMFTSYVTNVGSASVVSGSNTTTGSSVSSTLAATSSHLVLDGLAWAATHGTSDDAVPGSGQTEDYMGTGTGAFGDPDTILATSHKVAGATMSWSSITSSAAYSGAAHIAVGVLG